MKRIGRIKYITMGQYNQTTTYTEMQSVLYEGSRWKAKKETTGNARQTIRRMMMGRLRVK